MSPIHPDRSPCASTGYPRWARRVRLRRRGTASPGRRTPSTPKDATHVAAWSPSCSREAGPVDIVGGPRLYARPTAAAWQGAVRVQVHHPGRLPSTGPRFAPGSSLPHTPADPLPSPPTPASHFRERRSLRETVHFLPPPGPTSGPFMSFSGMKGPLVPIRDVRPLTGLLRSPNFPVLTHSWISHIHTLTGGIS